MDASLPYPSQRAPLGAANVVATSQPLAAQAGLDALRRGGNAVDAALATAIALTVVEPCSNGLGSDAFALVWDGAELHGLNASGRAPALWTPERFAGLARMPQFGWDAVTVPGAVSAWVALSARFGALPFEDLFTTAIRYAEHGFQVGPRTAIHWAEAAQLYPDEAEFARHFLPAPAAGERRALPDTAATLREIAASGGESFYRGELAARMEAAALEAGGALRAADLAAHQCDWVTPLAQPYRDSVLHEIPPNGQGLAAQIALGILAHFAPPPRDSADAMHLQIEAMKIALRAAADHFADPAHMRITPAELLDATSLARAASRIGRDASSLPPVALPTSPDTVYLTAADASGMMVSFIQSNYWGFGSGVVVPGTGIALQNRGFGFTLEPGHPNEVGPGKRPFHTIIPGFVTRAGEPFMSFGVMGGPMQAQGHVQMMTRVVDYGQNPQAASDAPRWQVLGDYSVMLEPGFPADVAEELARRGHQVRYDVNNHAFGGAQLIVRTAHGYLAGSDHRKEGQAVGY
ncbi:MAG: gamma-glutamyltransferase family protein [Gammaproteobacteria bacterium]